MQSIELAQQIISSIEEIPSITALTALDICRAVIKERDFISASSKSPDLFWSSFLEPLPNRPHLPAHLPKPDECAGA